jgi:hypothetical protein
MQYKAPPRHYVEHQQGEQESCVVGVGWEGAPCWRASCRLLVSLASVPAAGQPWIQQPPEVGKWHGAPWMRKGMTHPWNGCTGAEEHGLANVEEDGCH